MPKPFVTKVKEDKNGLYITIPKHILKIFGITDKNYNEWYSVWNYEKGKITIRFEKSDISKAEHCYGMDCERRIR